MECSAAKRVKLGGVEVFVCATHQDLLDRRTSAKLWSWEAGVVNKKMMPAAARQVMRLVLAAYESMSLADTACPFCLRGASAAPECAGMVNAAVLHAARFGTAAKPGEWRVGGEWRLATSMKEISDWLTLYPKNRLTKEETESMRNGIEKLMALKVSPLAKVSALRVMMQVPASMCYVLDGMLQHLVGTPAALCVLMDGTGRQGDGPEGRRHGEFVMTPLKLLGAIVSARGHERHQPFAGEPTGDRIGRRAAFLGGVRELVDNYLEARCPCNRMTKAMRERERRRHHDAVPRKSEWHQVRDCPWMLNSGATTAAVTLNMDKCVARGARRGRLLGDDVLHGGMQELPELVKASWSANELRFCDVNSLFFSNDAANSLLVGTKSSPWQAFNKCVENSGRHMPAADDDLMTAATKLAALSGVYKAVAFASGCPKLPLSKLEVAASVKSATRHHESLRNRLFPPAFLALPCEWTHQHHVHCPLGFRMEAWVFVMCICRVNAYAGDSLLPVAEEAYRPHHVCEDVVGLVVSYLFSRSERPNTARRLLTSSNEIARIHHPRHRWSLPPAPRVASPTLAGLVASL